MPRVVTSEDRERGEAMTRFPLTPNESAVAAYVVAVVEALTTTNGNVRAAAVALEMSEHTLRHRLKELGLVAWNQRAHPRSVRQPKRPS